MNGGKTMCDFAAISTKESATKQNNRNRDCVYMTSSSAVEIHVNQCIADGKKWKSKNSKETTENRNQLKEIKSNPHKV